MKECLVALLLALISGAALGQTADVALVNMVSGDVTYAPHAGTPSKVRPFMKVLHGDCFNVVAGGVNPDLLMLFCAEFSRGERLRKRSRQLGRGGSQLRIFGHEFRA